jgi:uncharacterized protein (UPF0332 family)
VTDEAEWGGKVLENAFEQWFRPELDRRANAGTITEGYSVWAMQAIFDLDLPAPIVNINDQISGVLRARSKGAISKGQQVGLRDLGDIEGIELTDAHQNAGHFTAILHNGSWFLAFDFRRNASRIAQHLDAVKEFLSVAEFSVENSLWRPAIENLFTSVELMAKSILMMVPDRRVLDAKSHQFVHTTFNLYSKTGLTEREHVTLLNELSKLRLNARYPKGPGPEIAECSALLVRAKEMLKHLEERRPRRYEQRDAD